MAWGCVQPEKGARIRSQSWMFFATFRREKKEETEVLRASRGKDRVCVPLGETERGGEKLCVCVFGGGGGQTARNRGNRGHEVSAEIKNEKRGNPRANSRGMVGREWIWLGERVMGVVGNVLGATQSTSGCQHLQD